LWRTLVHCSVAYPTLVEKQKELGVDSTAKGAGLGIVSRPTSQASKTEKPIALPLFSHQSARSMDHILPYLLKVLAFDPYDLMAMAMVFDEYAALKVAAINR